MNSTTIRNFKKLGDAADIPSLNQIQRFAYKRFLQKDVRDDERENAGLEAVLREAFPIAGADDRMKLHYVAYDLEAPLYTPEECRDLQLTHGYRLRVKMKLERKGVDEILEESVYLGDIPIMLGGGEFIINGATRVIVNQLHRSHGVDFVQEEKEGDLTLHGFRIIPERGSWIECSVTKREYLVIKIDQSNKVSATAFLRALDKKYGSTEAILREFYTIETIKAKDVDPDYWAVGPIINTETGEELCRAGSQIGNAAATKIRASTLKTLDVIAKPSDMLILRTIEEDLKGSGSDCVDSHDKALMRIYAKLRPGNPPQLDKAQSLFRERFFDDARYRLGRVGRFRINRKFDQTVPETEMVLRSEDVVNSVKYLLKLRANEGMVDDIDHLGNRRLRTIDELAAEEIRKGLQRLRRTVTDKMNMKNDDQVKAMTKISEIVNTKNVSSAVEAFFGRGELSQVVDQTNPLSQLTHERRLSALGPGGLNRKRAGFDVRDVHISHYGRICPIETPEGTNIGLIASLAIFADVDQYGFLITPYRVVHEGKVNGKQQPLRADEEMKTVLAPPEAIHLDGTLKKGTLLARANGDIGSVNSKDIQYVDISPKQMVSVSAALIPFLEHDDANRALMGSNMQRQAVPLLRTEVPVVGTGMERVVAANSSMVIQAEREGIVSRADATGIAIDGAEEYPLVKFSGLNDRTCLNQKPLVVKGQKVKRGQIIADGAATRNGELALGRNLLAAFMPFDGYNFEDAIVISERLVKEDVFTSLHVDVHEAEVRETRLGKEEFTRDIPNVSERALANLDESGVVRIGTRVGPRDILVGKISPKSKTELTPEEKLLQAIFGRAGEDVKNDSLEMPAGEEGVVIATKRFSRRTNATEEQRKAIKDETSVYEDRSNDHIVEVFRQMMAEVEKVLGTAVVDPKTRQKVGHSTNREVILEQVVTLKPEWIRGSDKDRSHALAIYERYNTRLKALQAERDRKVDQMGRGAELPQGVLEKVRVFVVTKRQISVGDKMAGRHGNKGVIARIVPEEDMPFLEDGTPVDIVLNPLGVPSRMNVGQILETHLGWAAKVLGFQAITPVFDGATEAEIFEQIEEANKTIQQRRKDRQKSNKPLTPRELDVLMPYGGKIQLHDGRTGQPMAQKTTVGYIYMMKLHHLVDDKIHARSTGPYSLITQQPLGGKARTGGQRFGEMEVWALEAYGASFILQELLTVKSDDVEGRNKIYESLVKGNMSLDAGTPVSFDVLCYEIRGLGLNIQLNKKQGTRQDAEDDELR